MTKDALWALYCKRNPLFCKPGGEVTMSVENLKKLFDVTFEQGHKLGLENAAALREKAKRARGPIGAMLGDMFD